MRFIIKSPRSIFSNKAQKKHALQQYCVIPKAETSVDALTTQLTQWWYQNDFHLGRALESITPAQQNSLIVTCTPQVKNFIQDFFGDHIAEITPQQTAAQAPAAPTIR